MEGDSSSTVIIDIENLQNFLKSNADHCWTSSSNINDTNTVVSISRVSQKMRQANKNAFDPIVLSIGPYHHGKHSLQAMEKRKWKYLDYILEATSRSLDNYIKGLREIYPQARSCYPDECNGTSQSFSQMLLLDGCFILLAWCKIDFRSHDHNSVQLIDDGNPTDPWQYYFVNNDLLLVENQIPFSVVKRVYEIITGEENTQTTLTGHIADIIEQLLLENPKAIRRSDRPKNFHHLLHLCHMYLRPSENRFYATMQMCDNSQSVQHWYRATEYHAAGINFERREFDETNPHSLLDVRLTENMVEIPHFIVDENITTILRNLIAFEQMNPRFGNDITAYIIFMSMLIRDAEDVNLLVSRGILKHHFQSEEEVAGMFMELSLGVEFDLSGSYYLKNICRGLGEFYESSTKWWKGWLR